MLMIIKVSHRADRDHSQTFRGCTRTPYEPARAVWHLAWCHIRGHIPKGSHTQTCAVQTQTCKRHRGALSHSSVQTHTHHPSYRRQFEGPHLARLYLPVCSFWPSLFIRLIKKSDPPACRDILTADSWPCFCPRLFIWMDWLYLLGGIVSPMSLMVSKSWGRIPKNGQ